MCGSTISLELRGPFYSDPYFAHCYEAVERAREQERSKLKNGEKLGEQMAYENEDHVLGLLSGEMEFESDDGSSYNVLLDVHPLHLKEISIKVHGGIIDVGGRFRPITAGTGEPENEENGESSLSSSLYKYRYHFFHPHGHHSRRNSSSPPKFFTREYRPSQNVDLDQAECNLSSDGVIHITAPILKNDEDDEREFTDKGCCFDLTTRAQTLIKSLFYPPSRLHIKSLPVDLKK